MPVKFPVFFLYQCNQLLNAQSVGTFMEDNACCPVVIADDKIQSAKPLAEIGNAVLIVPEKTRSKSDKQKYSSFLDGVGISVGSRQQENTSLLIRAVHIIDALYTSSFQDVNQFKKVIFPVASPPVIKLDDLYAKRFMRCAHNQIYKTLSTAPRRPILLPALPFLIPLSEARRL